MHFLSNYFIFLPIYAASPINITQGFSHLANLRQILHLHSVKDEGQARSKGKFYHQHRRKVHSGLKLLILEQLQKDFIHFPLQAVKQSK